MLLVLRGRLLASARIVADSGGRNEEFVKSRWLEIEAEVESGGFFEDMQLEPSSSRMRDRYRWDCSGSVRYPTYGASVLENIERDTKGLAGGFCELLLPE